MTEAELQHRIQAECTRRGLLWHHCPGATWCRGPRGFPDLVIAGPGGVIFAELKTEDGDTSAGQELWIWTLTVAGVVAVVLRPADLDSGRITRLLEAIKCES